MTDQLYRSIFSNVYIAKQIFTQVSVIQQYDNSLKYDDIIQVEWMNKYGHIGLLSDKLHRGAALFHEKSRDFSVFKALVEKDFDAFKIFYQRFYKYNTFIQEDNNYYSSFEQVVNTGHLEAVKWMCENGYSHQVKSWYRLDRSNQTKGPEIVRYLVSNGWFRVDFNLFWANDLNSLSNKPGFLQVMIDLAPKPIPRKQVQDIVNSLLEICPSQSVLDTLSPLIPDGLKIETQRDRFNVSDQAIIPVYQYIITRNLVDPHTLSLIQANLDRMDILSRKIKEFKGQLETLKSYDGQEYKVQLNELVKRQFPQGFPSDLLKSYHDTACTYSSIGCQIYRLPTDAVHALLDCGFEFTRDWFGKCLEWGSNELFVSLWNRFKANDQIRVSEKNNSISFCQDPMDKTKHSEYFHDEMACNWRYLNIHIIDFLLGQGCTRIMKQICRTDDLLRIKYRRKEDFRLIEKLIKLEILDFHQVLVRCIKQGNIALFEWLYPLRGEYKFNMHELLQELLKHQSTRVLELLNLEFSQIGWEQLLRVKSWKLCFLKQILASIPHQRIPLPTKLLQLFVSKSSYANAKHVLSNYRFESIAPILSTLAHRDSPAMLDLVYQYRDTAFINTPTQQDWDSLFKKCIQFNSDRGTTANLDYLTNHTDHILSCPIPKDMDSIEPHNLSAEGFMLTSAYFDPARHNKFLQHVLLHSQSRWADFFYLIDTELYSDSISLFVQYIVDKSNTGHYDEPISHCLDYLYNNQHRFTDAPSDKLEICRQILNKPIPEYLSSHIKSYYLNNKDHI
ncbi:hypothetical protein CYY_001639 [Polysphondylium violaceum]|uniref:Ankyrin repeat protein n=1 Tax=Polysphondylium violaceum TaxID=133409 RepID=A0A8J4V7R4_9MYCE|nr:hypothetical protein CYY_001639 [Polysphondylium violaceum]